MIKNLLIGLGSVGVVGAGGYGIYSATRSSGEDVKDDREIAGSNSEGDINKQTPSAGGQSGTEDTQSKGSTDSMGENGGTVGSPLTKDSGGEQASGSATGSVGGSAAGSGEQGTSS